MRYLFFALLSYSFFLSSPPSVAQEYNSDDPTFDTGDIDTGIQPDDPALDNDSLREEYHQSFGKDDAEPEELPPYEPVTSRDAREFSTLGVFYTYTPFAFLVSGRHGFEVDWIINEDWSLSGEYGKASYSTSFYSVDLASFSETVYGLHARYYAGNSFNLQFGLGRREHQLRLGEDLLPNGSETISASSNVLHFALGNRWQWANGISLGVDWAVFDIPVGATSVDDKDLSDHVKDKDDRKAVKEIISAMRYLPTIGVARVGIGYVF